MSQFKLALELAKQRAALALAANRPVCPNCRAKQIQLINWPGLNAGWRCRICRTTFAIERKP